MQEFSKNWLFQVNTLFGVVIIWSPDFNHYQSRQHLNHRAPPFPSQAQHSFELTWEHLGNTSATSGGPELCKTRIKRHPPLALLSHLSSPPPLQVPLLSHGDHCGPLTPPPRLLSQASPVPSLSHCRQNRPSENQICPSDAPFRCSPPLSGASPKAFPRKAFPDLAPSPAAPALSSN